VVAFLSTSLDNFGAMIALFAAHELRPRRVAAGYLGASWTVAAAAWGGSKLVELLPAPYLGLLGVIPLGLGLRRAWELRRSAPDVAGGVPTAGDALTAALVTLAQSADNSLVYVSLFADTADRLDSRLFATLVACPVLWCALAYWVARRSPVRGFLRRAMRLTLPFLLIALGIYILSDTVTDVLVR
jgi:cadmium resistance protein CadD (predicted permease)